MPEINWSCHQKKTNPNIIRKTPKSHRDLVLLRTLKWQLHIGIIGAVWRTVVLGSLVGTVKGAVCELAQDCDGGSLGGQFIVHNLFGIAMRGSTWQASKTKASGVREESKQGRKNGTERTRRNAISQARKVIPNNYVYETDLGAKIMLIITTMPRIFMEKHS